MAGKKTNRELMRKAVLSVAEDREEMLSSDEIMKEVCDTYEKLYAKHCGNAGSAKLHTLKLRTNKVRFGQFLRMYLTGWNTNVDNVARLTVWRRNYE